MPSWYRGGLLAFYIPAAAAGVLYEAPELLWGWHHLPESLENELVTVRFSLKQQGVAALRDVVEQVSNPSSPSYGRYFSREHVHELVAPAPEDVAAVEGWLRAEQVSFRRPNRGVVEATLPVRRAAHLLQTDFHAVANSATGQKVLRAMDFQLPAEVHAALAAVYGVHGLPLPRRELDDSSGGPPEAATIVTPSVITTRYGVRASKGMNETRTLRRRQAVAEFQDQTIDQNDLDEFFHRYLSDSSANAAKIYKYVGDNATGFSGVESALDVQYLMGVAPGLLTEYWYFDSGDFCTSLKNWTDAILASDDPPLVHSVSYGWQGDLDSVGCKEANVQDVDVNLMKLAARGITVVVASGDSGSGFSRSCSPADHRLNDTAVEGTLYVNRTTPNAETCCGLQDDAKAEAWSFVTPAEYAPSCSELKGVALEGSVWREFPWLWSSAFMAEEFCCVESQLNGDNVSGFTVKAAAEGDNESWICILYSEVTGHAPEVNATSSIVTPSNYGRCLLYSEATGEVRELGTVSGGDVGFLPPPKLWPSWPASSPWVTSVGATRLIQHNVTMVEQATDQFGSGGGFSDMFPAFKAQATAVQQYLKTARDLPPADSFPAGGRATPDVSAVGEGFQVIAGGILQTVAGTSASTPVFAALVSLLNEARLAANKPPMGYINNWLYAHPEAFTDVTVGTNAIDGIPLRYGFTCSMGWDPVTGLGTPIFHRMVEAALADAPQDFQYV